MYKCCNLSSANKKWQEINISSWQGIGLQHPVKWDFQVPLLLALYRWAACSLTSLVSVKNETSWQEVHTYGSVFVGPWFYSNIDFEPLRQSSHQPNTNGQTFRVVDIGNFTDDRNIMARDRTYQSRCSAMGHRRCEFHKNMVAIHHNLLGGDHCKLFQRERMLWVSDGTDMVCN